MKNRFPRDFYIPKGAVKIADKASDAVAYVAERAGKIVALGFHGAAQKPDWHYLFRNMARCQAHIAAFFEGRQKTIAFRAKIKADSKASPIGLEVGDVLRTSWGYDQTNVDFYEVTAIVGKRMVEVRKIAQHVTQTAWEQGKCAPKPGEYVGDPIRVMARNGGAKIEGHYASLQKPEIVAGVKVYRSAHWSSYA